MCLAWAQLVNLRSTRPCTVPWLHNQTPHLRLSRVLYYLFVNVISLSRSFTSHVASEENLEQGHIIKE